MRTSGIVTYYLSALPVDAQGQTLPGLVQVTLNDYPLPADETHPEPRHVYETHPDKGVADLPGTPASIEVIGTPWTVEALRAMHPVQATYCLNAEWEQEVTDDAGTYMMTRRDREILIPEGVVPRRTGIPSHIWAEDR